MKVLNFIILSYIILLTSSYSFSSDYDELSPVYYSSTVIVNGNVQVTVEVLDIVKTCNSWGFHYGFIVRIKSNSLNNSTYNFTYNIYFHSSTNPGGHAYGGAFQLSNSNESNIYQIFNNGFQVNCTNLSNSDCLKSCENFSVLDANLTSFQIDYWAPNGSVTGNLATPLNVKLTDFSLKNNNGTNIIQWNIDKNSEYDVDYYTIEHSNDGYQWNELDKIYKHTDNNYKYHDRASSSDNYYRLNSISYEGIVDILKIGYIKNNSSDSDYKLYNLLGYEVDDSYKGVVIKRYGNGHIEKLYK